MAEDRPFLDFKAIKARASITAILDRYGVKLIRVNQTTLKGNCPLPTHSSKSKNTFYVSEAKSAWYCHSDSCKKNGNRAGGNVIDFVAAMENISIYDAADNRRYCQRSKPKLLEQSLRANIDETVLLVLITE